jgi:hypothetical protein
MKKSKAVWIGVEIALILTLIAMLISDNRPAWLNW